MTPSQPRSLVCVSLLAAGGCAAHWAVKENVPVQRAVAERPSILLEAIQQNVIAQGWDVVTVDDDNGTVVALQVVESPDATPMRQRWTFSVADGQLGVSMRLEVQFDPGRWVTSNKVCRGYEFAREQHQLERVLDLVPSAMATLAAARPVSRTASVGTAPARR